MTRIYISAGEPSADAHAAAVATALRRRLPGLELEALGGPLLERAGARVLDRMESYSVVGFVEAIEKIPASRPVLVTHGTAIRIAVTVLLNLPVMASRHFAQDNAAVNLFVRRGDRLVMKVWNDTSHCEG